MTDDEAAAALLDAAERLFYANGIQAVGMDALRTESGVSLKRTYRCFPAKEDLVAAYLARRDERWRARLARYVRESGAEGADAPLAVFDWLYEWFGEPDFRGCAFVNSFAELGARSAAVAGAARAHKDEVARYLESLVIPLRPNDSRELAEQLLALADGASTLAAITGDRAVARSARAAAATLIAGTAAAR